MEYAIYNYAAVFNKKMKDAEKIFPKFELN